MNANHSATLESYRDALAFRDLRALVNWPIVTEVYISPLIAMGAQSRWQVELNLGDRCVAFDADTELFRLYATAHGYTALAGPRHFRAPPHPDIKFAHDSQAGAEADAAILRDYLSRLPQKAPSKKSRQKDWG